jgi:hypothetical protein
VEKTQQSKESRDGGKQRRSRQVSASERVEEIAQTIVYVHAPAEMVSLGAGARLPHTREARTYVSRGSATVIGERAESGGGRYGMHPSRLTLGRERKHYTT